MFHFHRNYYSVLDKIYQDNFIIKHVTATPVKRRRPRSKTKENQRQFTMVYKIYSKKQNKYVQVCKMAFMSILRINKSRIEGVMKRHAESGTMAKENRGGDRKLFQFASRKEAIQNFIKKFKPLETHHSRGQIKIRMYLSPDLNVKKMWQMYNDEALPGYEVKIGYFRKVFNTSFNIGFGSPRQDVCSDCLQLLERIKLSRNEQEKQGLRTQYRVHKLRAKCYFENLREESPNLQILSFDCQKNLPLPKVPDQSVYYSRQLYLYNLTVVVGTSKASLTPENVHAYVWTEEQAAKGSNEICSCVYDCLNSLDFTGKEKVRLVADGCGGQNKNSMLITMAMKWLYDSRIRFPNLTELQLVFPVTGHSFIPPDRVFALTEKQIRRRENIIQPQEYMDLIANHATIHKVKIDVPILDWKTERQNNLKSTFHFQVSKCKRIIITRTSRDKIEVTGEISYRNNLGGSASLLKRGKRMYDIDPSILESAPSVNPDKLVDVEKLLQKHFGPQWDQISELQFYKNILQSNVVPMIGEREEEIINNSEEYEMQEVLDFV
ncbi:uncharacterized protein LOC126381200 [Pectinophora gossypiella]|uniref:uncharacterized protein LOC126370958 n=1 Tax=Pectinophora gossypiella TaxID=13191 RepID=UPI00214E576E|nr:uncharacterized protein LOC126370958 [Pectinophora gossypiella]XP_049884177.1 uncharacterized protein LOC126379461 [Pectinophora gossypiella]XP_049886673.1 uncharacterized protein LOC126381200 [Pectinophora gossypiella]XP_049886674.1 uncharacterized protein LOC126381200 [Pectinophora gossypiella]